MSNEARTASRVRAWWPVAAALVLIAVFALKIPLGSILVLGLVLLCPLLMMGMHGGAHTRDGDHRNPHDAHES